MAWRPRPRMAQVDASAPRAWGTCQRCGFVGNLGDFQQQMEWRGTRIMPLNLLVCQKCLDEPQRQLGTIILPPDPVGIPNARPEQYPIDEYTLITFEVTYQYPGAGSQAVRPWGDPIYAEVGSSGAQGQHVAIAAEYPIYFDTD